MDSLSQLVLGASIGEATLGKKAGNKAPIWGAIAGTIPDLDVIPGNFINMVDRLDFHRGFSHSVIFFLLLSPLLGYLVNKLHKKDNIGWKGWSLLFFFSLFTHSLLDCFTTWGTQLFWPSEGRVAWQSIFVVDPLYTLPFLIFLILAVRLHRTNPKRQKWNTTGLSISTAYLLFTLFNKAFIINPAFEKAIAQQELSPLRVDTRPAPLQNILWAASIETEEGYYIGYHSWFDKDLAIPFTFYPKQHALLDPWKNHPDILRLQSITKGYYTVRKNDEGYIMNDLRFGQLDSWRDTGSPFVFAYKIVPGKNGELTITERPRDSTFKKDMFSDYWKRILGKRFL